jgi:hypothetical protein
MHELGCAKIARAAIREAPRQSGAELLHRCPNHEDKHPSLKINTKKNCWMCGPCQQSGGAWDLAAFLSGHDPSNKKAIVAWLRDHNLLPPRTNNGRRIVAQYSYTDEDGHELFQQVRYEPKDFKCRRQGGSGEWIYNAEGVRLVPYNLAEVKRTDEVWIVEGEKDVDNLKRWGLVGTTNPFGAGKWRPEFNPHFSGKSVAILPDNDRPGEQHAHDVARNLLPVARQIKIVRLPGLPEKGDFSDWQAAGGSPEELLGLRAAEAPIKEATLGVESSEDATVSAVRTEVADGWPKPELMQDELPPVQAFSEELLPESLRGLVVDTAERMQVAVDIPAAMIVLCLAGAVNRRAMIQPKVHDTGWVVVPNLWGGVVAPSGFMKSPTMVAVTRALNDIQELWWHEYRAALEDYASEKEKCELRHNAWRDAFKFASKKGNPLPADRPTEELKEPTLRRVVVNDSTFEALHKTMNENRAGVLMIRDEITGWLSRLDQDEHGNERGFALQAWNGDSGYIVDRIGRGIIYVPHCCMSVLGGITPDRLRSYLADVLKGAPGNDGLIQRFQVLVWPDKPAGWKLVDRTPDPGAHMRAASVFRALVEMDADNPTTFHFAPDAQELFFEWLAELESKIRGGELHEALTSHLSKYRSLMPSLALLFELADRAAGDFDVLAGSSRGDHPESFLVSLEHAKQAAEWCDYLESHARRVYAGIVTPQVRAARDLADKIRQRKVGAGGSFSCREVYNQGWSGLGSPEAVRLAAELLQDAGWVRPVVSESSDSLGRGRPANRWLVNPRLWQ